MTTAPIDEHTRAGHERFKDAVPLQCGDGHLRTLNQWLDWQKHRDPFVDSKKSVPLFRRNAEKQMEAEREAQRGPGLAKRPRPSRPGNGAGQATDEYGERS